MGDQSQKKKRKRDRGEHELVSMFFSDKIWGSEEQYKCKYCSNYFLLFGFMFDDRRMGTTPTHIEEQVFLKLNLHLWNEKTFFQYLDKADKWISLVDSYTV
jgi:hypothetical protein